MIRLLHFFWDGPPMPDHFRENLMAWHDLHPDWELIVWDSTATEFLENRELYDDAAAFVPRDAIWQFRSDIARYEILKRHGGFYADIDTRPLQPIDRYIEGHDAFAAREDPNWVGNTYLYAGQVDHPLFRALIERLPANAKRKRGYRANHVSGPRYLTPIWTEFGAYAAPSHQWFPYSYVHVKKLRSGIPLPPLDPRFVVAEHQWNHHREALGVGYP